MTIKTKMTANELQKAHRAAKSKVELHFTAKGNPAWRVYYRYGRHDLQIGHSRITKKEADERLAEFGLTANLVVEIVKALEKAQAAKTAAMKASGEIYTAGRNGHKLTPDEITAVYAKFATAESTDSEQFTFDVQRFATTDFVEDAIETLDNDMKDEVREQFAPYKAEFNAAIAGIYLDDLSSGDSESGEIIPAADLLQKVIPLALTDFSSTAYRKNPDGTFSRDKAAFKRLEQVEIEMFTANGHKIGIDNPDWYAANFDDDNAPRI